MKIRWTILDRFIAFLRYSKIKRHIMPNTILCDVGCGFNGSFLLSQSDFIKEGYGFDRKVANDNFGNIHLKEIDNLELGIPLADESVNIATLMALVEHLNDPGAVLRETYRILKKGGHIVLTTPTPLSKPILEFMAYRLKIISEEEIRDHKHYFSNKELYDLLKAIGFSQVKVKNFQLGCNQIAIGLK
jgi:ubiquinone/menaquinone biosynthesis C-methylase UbiE